MSDGIELISALRKAAQARMRAEKPWTPDESVDDIFPYDLARQLDEVLTAYVNHEVSSLDEAFGVKRPKGYRQRYMEQLQHGKGASIWDDIVTLHAHGLPLDEYIFGKVGELHGTGSTYAKKAYYHHQRRIAAEGHFDPWGKILIMPLRADLEHVLLEFRPDLATSAKSKK